jgi:hypothetical protein
MPSDADLLTEQLLKLAVASSSEAGAAAGPALRASTLAALESASADAVRACLVRLDEHRLLGLAHYGLAQHGLLDRVPAEHAKVLAQHFRFNRGVHTLFALTLQGLAAKLRAVGVTTVSCKGVVLTSHFYPDPGMRTMMDVDLWLPEESRDLATRTIGALGFRPQADKQPHPESDNFVNGAGVSLDVHWRMRLFEAAVPRLELVTEPAPHGGYSVFQPEAMLAHLCVHMIDHFPDTGPVLCWLIDLGFVLGKLGDRLDLERLQRLLPCRSYWLCFLRGSRFLKEALGFRLPAALDQAAAEVAPLRLSAILRLRRLALWRLPRPGGWGRLLGVLTGTYDPGGRPWPSAQDLVLWPADAAQHWWLARRTGARFMPRAPQH